MSAWQDIASAPKDGTWILVILAGEWTPGVPFLPEAVRWGTCPISEEDGWLRPDSQYGTDTLFHVPVTHWMPLPEPPEGSA